MISKHSVYRNNITTFVFEKQRKLQEMDYNGFAINSLCNNTDLVFAPRSQLMQTNCSFASQN
jgi:hypothetical protein